MQRVRTERFRSVHASKRFCRDGYNRSLQPKHGCQLKDTSNAMDSTHREHSVADASLVGHVAMMDHQRDAARTQQIPMNRTVHFDTTCS